MSSGQPLTTPQTTPDHSRSPASSEPSTVHLRGPTSIEAVVGSPVEEARSQVYVVHHDGGRPPVTVYTADGTEVVELPPRYNESATGPTRAVRGAGARQREGTVPPLQVQERRQTGPNPPKPPPVRRVMN